MFGNGQTKWPVQSVRSKRANTTVNADIYMAHGINEYSGRTATAASVHLRNGFRVIGIDMPSFGRSSGLHGYLPTLRWNEGALNAVMLHVHMWDEYEQLENLANRKRFAQGASMGGFTCAYHAALHPPPSTSVSMSLNGICLTAPMLQISPITRPNVCIEAIARMVSLVAGRLGVLQPIRGHLSDDPNVEFYARQDRQGYLGRLRIDTGLGIADGLTHLDQIAGSIRCPILIFHGTADRVTDPDGSQLFYDRLLVQDKTIKFWPGWEHGMYVRLMSQL